MNWRPSLSRRGLSMQCTTAGSEHRSLYCGHRWRGSHRSTSRRNGREQTGRHYGAGNAESRLDVAYGNEYNDIARREGIALSRRPMIQEERAAGTNRQALAKVILVWRSCGWRHYYT